MTEKAVGYTTIGGDLEGGLSVISNVPKTVVIFLLEHLQRAKGWRGIEVVLSHPAGPELAPDQQGEKELMPYAVLDACFALHAGEKMSADDMVTALGSHRAGIFTNDAALQAQAAAAGDQVGEALWPMPIGARHREDLHSEIADLKQCCAGTLLPDASHAAAFLREFAGDTPWAHLDIAGVRLDEKGLPTGFGARLLDRLVELYFEHPDRH
jgi:leucyl aminopeptidase